MLWNNLFRFFIILLPFSFALSPSETIDLSIVRIFAPGIFIIWLLSRLKDKKLLIDKRPQVLALCRFSFFGAYFIFLVHRSGKGAEENHVSCFFCSPLFCQFRCQPSIEKQALSYKTSFRIKPGLGSLGHRPIFSSIYPSGWMDPSASCPRSVAPFFSGPIFQPSGSFLIRAGW